MHGDHRHGPRGTSAVWLTVLALVTAALIAGSGCGDGEESADGGGGRGLSPEIEAAGKVRVAIDVSYPPLEFFADDGSRITGFDYDLGMALGRELGVPFEFVNTGFDGIIPALQGRRFDLVMSAMNDTPERRRVLDFVDYLNVGTSILVPKGNPQDIQGASDLCGKVVAVQKATTQVDFAASTSERCEQSGDAPLKVSTFPKNTDALLQVRSGRADANLSDSPVAVYTAKTSGGGDHFEVVDSPLYDPQPYGIGMRKGQASLRNAIKGALQSLMRDGTYDRLVEKYGLQRGAMETATVNAG